MSQSSNIVFTPPKGLGWPRKMRPVFATTVMTPVNGAQELRSSLTPYPIWEFDLKFNYAKGAEQVAASAAQYLLQTFINAQGQYIDFLYQDPNDNAVVAAQFATGDGTSTQFQLVKPIGTAFDIVQNLNGSPSVYSNYWEGNQLQYATARINWALWSQDFTQTAWVKTNITVTANATTAPDGTNTATKLAVTANGIATVRQGVAGAGVATGNTFSVFAKQGSGATDGNGFILRNDTTATNLLWVKFNFSTQAFTYNVGVSGASAVALAGGWFKISLTVTSGVSNGDTIGIYTGWDTSTQTAAQFVYMWGAQVEGSTVATSYIATSAATATRTDYSLGSTGLVTFAVAPVSTAVLTWTGSYYYRVRFADDGLVDFQSIMFQIWELGSLKLRRVLV